MESAPPPDNYWVGQKIYLGISLVAQWIGNFWPTQGTQVPSLVWEDFTCHGATQPVCHNYRSLPTPETVLPNKKSHRKEKPGHHNRVGPTRHN